MNKPLISRHRKNLIALGVCSALGIGDAAQAATFEVIQNLDDGVGNTPNTLSWAIRQANITGGQDTIVLKTNVEIQGRMNTLINSDIILESDPCSVIPYTISGRNVHRPLFVKSGAVTIQNVTLANGNATGTAVGGSGAGAGLGGRCLFMTARSPYEMLRSITIMR